tara:strand:- start:1058 stop:1525 length:468 start_codon:yes stop_codon:yes gene_type:complete
LVNQLIINDELTIITKEQQYLVKKSISLTLQEEISRQKVNVIFVDENEMKRINLQFRGVDSVTDVLSFQNNVNNKYYWPNEKKTDEELLGEIIICFSQLKRQSLDKKVELDYELALICVHGVLHLLGYDHHTKIEKRIMYSKTDNLLKNIFYKNE